MTPSPTRLPAGSAASAFVCTRRNSRRKNSASSALKPASALLAVLASSEEQSLDRAHTWTPASLGASTRAWLDFIATHLGYEWTDWEAAQLAAADEADAKAFLATDPFARNGLFSGVEVKPWRRTFGAALA